MSRLEKSRRSRIENAGLALAAGSMALGAAVIVGGHETAPPKLKASVSETVQAGSNLWNIGAATLRAEGIPANDANTNATKVTLEYASNTSMNAGNVEAGQNFSFDPTHPIIHPEDLRAVGASIKVSPNNNQS
jgi:hypothetical protein